jgi:uncharacterized membrane protein
MKNNYKWLIISILLAVVVHWFSLWRTPNFISGVAMSRMPTNEFLHRPLPIAGEDKIVQTSPDILYSASAYHIDNQAIKLDLSLPKGDNYWSLSLFADNTDNFFVLNDRQARQKFKKNQFSLVLIPQGSKMDISADQIVEVPSKKGIILIRMIVKNPKDSSEIAELSQTQKQNKISLVNKK